MHIHSSSLKSQLIIKQEGVAGDLRVSTIDQKTPSMKYWTPYEEADYSRWMRYLRAWASNKKFGGVIMQASRAQD